MKLSEIIKNVKNLTVYGEIEDLEINEITKDSRRVSDNGLFFCLRGVNNDGHLFATEAVENGAKAIVCEKYLNKIDCVQIVTPDVRGAYSYFSAAFYDNPQKKVKMIAVVGTNGKTSVSNIVYNVLTAAGKKCAVIGTLGAKCDGLSVEVDLTTPDPDRLFALLKDFVKKKVEYVVMELSAHAIFLKKTVAINFECTVFTNCTHDHLDYFADFSNYRKVKKSAFNKKSRFFIVNADDALGREIYAENVKKTVTYGIYSPADVFAVNVRESLSGVQFVLNMFDMVFKVKSSLLGEFNVSNLLAACCVCFLCGIKPEKIVEYIITLPIIDGRMEPVATFSGGKIFIDYAHTPDGLNKSLSFLASITKGETIVCFGAGGERDRLKRPLMGKVAGDIANFTILTTDNPRSEKAEKIICDVEKGVKEVTDEYVKIVDRYDAIKYGVKMLKKGDTLLIAGRGAEREQEVNGVKLKFSDKDVVLKIIKELETACE